MSFFPSNCSCNISGTFISAFKEILSHLIIRMFLKCSDNVYIFGSQFFPSQYERSQNVFRLFHQDLQSDKGATNISCALSPTRMALEPKLLITLLLSEEEFYNILQAAYVFACATIRVLHIVCVCNFCLSLFIISVCKGSKEMVFMWMECEVGWFSV